MTGSRDYPAFSVRASRGMVAAGEPLSALAGVEILMKGGNAMDAALAVAGVNLVTMPGSAGLGGDAFILVHTAGETWDIRGSGAAPVSASRDFFMDGGFDRLPLEGVLSVSVPGAPAAYQEAWIRHGSMDWQALWEPAIFYAQEGFPVSEGLSLSLQASAPRLNQEASSTLLPGGRPPAPGSRLIQPRLAESLKTLAVEGAGPFYSGEIAARYVAMMEEEGGLITQEDLDAHRTQLASPLVLDYGNYKVYQTGPPSQGFIMLQALGMTSGWDLASMDPGKATHMRVEAIKRAYRDRLEKAGDPAFTGFRAEALLAEDHLEAARQLVDPTQASPWPPGIGGTGDTTSFVVVDSWGNGVSFIHSLSHPFGSGAMVPETGILLNNRLGRGFTLEEGHPNCLEPGKRTMHTLNTYLVTGPQGLSVLGNTPGGDAQPQWNFQVLSAILDLGLGAQEAVSRARWTISPGTDPSRMGQPPLLQLEGGLGTEVGDALVARGHPVRCVDAFGGGGSAQVILVGADCFEGGSDPRGGGLALGF